MVSFAKGDGVPLINPFGRKVLLGFAMCAGILWASNSEAVVDFVFGFGDEPPEYYSPAGFPLDSQRTVALGEWDEIALPDEVKQPSGLSVRGNHVVISTDMSTVHWGQLGLGSSASLVVTQDTQMLRRPLLFRQGYLEATTQGEEPNVSYVMGGGNHLYRLIQNDDGVTISSKVTIAYPKGVTGTPEIVGMSYRRETDTLILGYSPANEQGIALAEYSTDGQFLRSITLTHPDIPEAQLDRLLENANVVGVAVSGNHLIVLSDKHSGLLWIDVNSGEIQDIWTMEGLSTVSGVALDDGKLYVLQDHEYYQPIPPLRVLSLPTAE